MKTPTTYTPSEADKKKIEIAFTYHAPHGDQPERYVEIRDAAKALALLLVVRCPSSRELSLAITHLEECVMFANAAIARGEAE